MIAEDQFFDVRVGEVRFGQLCPATGHYRPPVSVAVAKCHRVKLPLGN